MATYRYRFYDLTTRTELGDLPLEGVSYARMVSGVGDLNAKSPYLIEKDSSVWWSSTIPVRTVLFVQRDDRLMWGGIIWKRSYDSSTGQFTLLASEPLSLLSHRFVPTVTHTNKDQFFIARYLAGLSTELSLLMDTSINSGVLRDRTYDLSERKQALEALDELSRVDNGFEYTTDYSFSSTEKPEWRLRLGYPRISSATVTAPLTLEYPGAIDSYTWPEDGSVFATRVLARSDLEDGGFLLASASRNDLMAAGYPVLEVGETFSKITVNATLVRHANQLLADKAGQLVTPTITFSPDLALGTMPFQWEHGQDVRIRISDNRRFVPPPSGGPGLDLKLRIISATITVGATGEEEISVELSEILETV
jgi:hypothetical protein